MREAMLALGFLGLVVVGVLTVARPELADAPEEQPQGNASGAGSGEADAGVAGIAPPASTTP